MSLHISGIINPNSQVLSQQGSQTASVSSEGGYGQQSGGKEPLNLSIGSTVSGTVEETQQDMISIRLSNGRSVLAKLEDALAFGRGDKVTFSVSGMSDGQYILKSLFQNTAMQATGEKALLQAGIAVNENSLSMVSEMMEDGMSIDKSSLQTMYKEVAAHPQTSGANIVAMNRLQIPITDANIAQFQAYMNLEHQISEGISKFSDSLMQSYKQLSAGQADQASGLMQQMIEQFGVVLDESELAQMRLSDSSEASAQSLPGEMENLTQQEGQTGSVLQEGKLSEQGPASLRQAVDNTSEGASYLETLKKLMQSTDALEEGKASERAENIRSYEKTDTYELQRILKNLGMNEETLSKLQQGDIGDKELIGFAKAMLGEALASEDQHMLRELNKLFGLKEFQSSLKNEMGRQLLLSPELLSQKEDVEAYYAKLQEQLGKLSKAVSQFLPQDSQPMQQLSSMQDNLQFMEHMNQTMSYIQLPMKLLSDQAHGDLYVYTNKKHMAQSDGSVSAFLHLDMDHLGPVDVYVAMQEKKVSTNFYLRDDEMIDFIAQRIDQLNERLEKKGYQMTANITKKEKETSVMKEIIEDHKEVHMIGTRSFDVRA